MEEKTMIDYTGFFYGTLKKGFHNSHYCKGARRIEEAAVCGKLYQLPPGYPALQIPKESILWQGTKDVFADAQNQEMENDSGDFEFKIYDGWDVVHGELVTFSDPEDSIPNIDDLEGFPFFYDRILVPVKKSDGIITTAYVYTMDKIHMSARYLPDGIWPPKKRSMKNV
jgi:gamma-glutamylcyclotransferase (GGCT)/AIG2-like uncharacterized protein YtfP